MANLFFGQRESDFYIPQHGVGHLLEVPDPLEERGTVMQFWLHNEDGFPVTPTEDPRCQLAPFYVIEANAIDWARIQFMVPSKAKGGPPPISTSSFLQLLQIYGPPQEAVTPFGIKLSDLEGKGENWLEFRRNATYGFDCPWREKVKTDHWYELITHFKFAYAADGGFMECWLDGVPLTFWQPGTSSHPERADTTKLDYETRDTGVNDADSNSWIIQSYRQKGSWEPFSIYFDEVSIATTKADLDPPGGDGKGEWSYIGQTTKKFAEYTVIEFPVPEGTKEGDQFVIAVQIYSSSKTITPGAGLTERCNKVQTGGGEPFLGRCAVFEGVWDGKFTPTLTLSAKNSAQAHLLAYRGGSETPYDADQETVGSASSATLAIDGATAGFDGELAIAFGFSTNWETIAAIPAGMTKRIDHEGAAGSFGMFIADKELEGAGAVGDQDFTLKAAGWSVGFLLLLKSQPLEVPSTTGKVLAMVV